jgi:hypothetical protein
MKKILIPVFILIIILAIYVSNKKNNKEIPSTIHDYKTLSYEIDGERIKIKDDIKYFGNNLKTDLNNDGREDIVFLITRQSGGSGTFYYVLSALNMKQGYIGSDGYFLGDRIAPQNIEVSKNPNQKNVIVVNYADRLPNEPMSTQPSVGKSVYLKLDPVTMQWGVVEANFEGESK